MRTAAVTGLALSGAVLATALAFLAHGQPVPTPAVPFAQPPGGPAGGVPPGVAGMEPPTKVEWMIGRPNAVTVRDVIDVGEVDLGQNAGMVRVQGLIVSDPDKPADRVRGLAVVLNTAAEPVTVVFDAEQVPDLIKAIDHVSAVAAKQRVPAADTRRQAVIVLNGLEIGVAAGGVVGHLGRVGPDQPSVRLGQAEFAQLRDHLARGRDMLARDAKHLTAGGGGAGGAGGTDGAGDDGK